MDRTPGGQGQQLRVLWHDLSGALAGFDAVHQHLVRGPADDLEFIGLEACLAGLGDVGQAQILAEHEAEIAGSSEGEAHVGHADALEALQGVGVGLGCLGFVVAVALDLIVVGVVLAAVVAAIRAGAGVHLR